MTNKQNFASSREIGRGKERVFIEWRALTCPRAEYTAETTEDRYAERAGAGLFAVADGVGASFKAADWAKAVVDAWAQTPFNSAHPFEVEGWLRKLQPQFVMRPEEIAALQPYAQAAARRGAGCTFLGLRMWPAHDGKSALYSLLCVGDSDLIHYPVRAFPITSPDKFGSYPTVLRSKGFDREQDRVLRYPDPASQVGPDGQPSREELYERLRPGDTLALCTDALAHWALDTDLHAWYHEDAPDSRSQLEAQTQETWPAFIEELRHTGKIVDDDTTALFIRIAQDQRSSVASVPGAHGWRRVELSITEIAHAENEWVSARQREMAQALRQQPRSAIEVARIYGDGRYFSRNYKEAQAVAELAHQGRGMARALDKINAALRAVSWERPTREQLDAVAELQRKYAERLRDEPTAQGALTTMRDLLAHPSAPTPPQPGGLSAGLVARPLGMSGYHLAGEAAQPGVGSADGANNAPSASSQSVNSESGVSGPAGSDVERGS